MKNIPKRAFKQVRIKKRLIIKALLSFVSLTMLGNIRALDDLVTHPDGSEWQIYKDTATQQPVWFTNTLDFTNANSWTNAVIELADAGFTLRNDERTNPDRVKELYCLKACQSEKKGSAYIQNYYADKDYADQRSVWRPVTGDTSSGFDCTQKNEQGAHYCLIRLAPKKVWTNDELVRKKYQECNAAGGQVITVGDALTTLTCQQAYPKITNDTDCFAFCGKNIGTLTLNDYTFNDNTCACIYQKGGAGIALSSVHGSDLRQPTRFAISSVKLSARPVAAQ